MSIVPAFVLQCKYKILSFTSRKTTSRRIKAEPLLSVDSPVCMVVSVDVRIKSSPRGSRDRQHVIFVAPLTFCICTSNIDAQILICARANRSISRGIFLLKLYPVLTPAAVAVLPNTEKFRLAMITPQNQERAQHRAIWVEYAPYFSI